MPREWTLKGCEIRELLVPDLDAEDIIAEKAHRVLEELDGDDSPAAELSRLPIPPLPVARPDQTTTSSNPSSLFTDNQLINSWIRRNQRDPPMHMIGDPNLGLNPSQTKAVAMSLGERICLIQGVSPFLIIVRRGLTDEDVCAASWDG